jgi:hypothetical protein
MREAARQFLPWHGGFCRPAAALPHAFAAKLLKSKEIPFGTRLATRLVGIAAATIAGCAGAIHRWETVAWVSSTLSTPP